MSEPNDNGNNEHGVRHVVVPTLIITLNPDTHQVGFQCEGIAIAVAQMMVDEVRRQLDIQRRQAAQLELVKNLQEQQRVAGIMAATQRGR